MAEVSALTPSPPAMVDQSVAPPPPPSAPSLPAVSPKPVVLPKSALYGDRAVMAAAALTPLIKETSVPLPHSGEATSSLPENPPSVTAASECARPPDRGDGGFLPTPEPLTQQNLSKEPPGGAAIPEAPPFPAQNPTTHLDLTSNSMSSSHTPPRSPPPLATFDSDPLSDPKSDLPCLVVHDSSVPFVVPPPAQSGPALDTLSYLESASMMSGTLDSLSGIGEDGSSLGSDSELNGPVSRRTDKYGFLGGTQYSEGNVAELSVEVARHREMKWLDMFKNWDKWISRRFPKVKLRCRKGIPSSLRSRAWQLLSNSEELLMANIGKFEELEREPGDPKWLDIIEKDLHRQFPFHEMFAARGGHGQQDLYRILKAYTVYRPDEGYCQAQAPVAAVLLMHMPAEQAFWCLVQICEKYLPGYYSAGLEAIQLDGEIFFSLLRRVCPMAYRHLKKFKIDPILYMTEWFMCIFSRTLPWSCVLRVWDMFFCEGVKIVFRVGLVLLKQMLGSVDKLREVQGMYETMERLRNISPDSIREEMLVHEVTVVPVTEALIERECAIQVKKWRESRGALTHQPGRRLHGTRDIHEQKRRAAAISSGGSLSFLGSSMSSPPPGPLRSSSSLLSLPGFRKSKNPFSYGKKSSFSGETQVFGGGTPIMITSSGPPRPPVSAAAPPAGGAGAQRPSPLVAKPPTAPKSPVSNSGPELTSAPKSEPEPTSAPKSGPEPPSAPKSEPEPTPSPKSEPTPAPKSEPEPTPESAAKPTSEPASVSKSSEEPAPPSIPNQLQPPRVVSEQVTPTIPSPTANNVPLPLCEDEGKKKKKKSKEEKKKEKEEEKLKAREKKERDKAEKEKARKEKERAEKEKEKAEKEKEKAEKKKEKVGKKKDKAASAEAEEKNGAAAAKHAA
ncbi:TBC1 domain family member 10B-like [Ictalurus furcatus]|uniref:TBC1 domain family member 10B-like n=1 Tax=Ictalurus furcatus TaxID=66913 RepID=UPI00234FECF2|nr:TBC1 domain family member 10B-like [Ictalurus furcatus]XP_053473577.1 TBC1 domain family member 10B-like [Ictalurus furcatus]